MKTPCETAIWYILPAIRRELTRNLVQNIGIRQHNAAQLMGISDAAVSQYLSGQRAKFVLTDPEILDEISTTAQRIFHGKELTADDLCRICTRIRSKVKIVNNLTGATGQINR